MSAQPIVDPRFGNPGTHESAADLRAAFGRAASSTWVVTASGERGPVGFTAISVVSVSLAPPLASFNIAKRSSSLATITRTGRAALHLLADDQSHLAQRFAEDRTKRFVDDGAWAYDEEGLPAVHNVASRLLTRVQDLVDSGDSFVVIARVDQAVTSTRRPLLHHAGRYLTPIHTNGV